MLLIWAGVRRANLRSTVSILNITFSTTSAGTEERSLRYIFNLFSAKFCNLVENALYLVRSELCSNFDFLQSDHGLCQDIRGDVGQIRANDVQPPQLDVLTAGDLVKQSQRLVSRKPFSINILNRDQGISENNRRNK